MQQSMDSTLRLALEGYGWLPNLRRRSGGTVHTRLLGKPAVGLCGPAAARFFYNEEHVHRHGAIPGPVLRTLFGHGAVHTLDLQAHRVRKAMFLSLVTPDRVDALVERTEGAWDAATRSWGTRSAIVLFDEASRVLTRAACDWAGVPLPQAQVPALAADLVAMVDGFATAGPRYWRARRARARWAAWIAGLVEEVRVDGCAPGGSVVSAVAHHRDAEGEALEPRLAAAEVINVLRPTVALSWFVAFAGHALHRWPRHRVPLHAGDASFAEAFAHELRRFYPFAPFVAGQAVRDLRWEGGRIPAGATVLLDLYGQDHDPVLWPDPYRFDPYRFLGRTIGPYELVPQGAGDAYTGHRCPGEGVAVALLSALAVRLARLDYEVPDQDLTIPLRRIPTRPGSGLILTGVRTPAARRSGADAATTPAAYLPIPDA
jgi:fatty-acid peroxygenase